ncbi:hypothetical protein [Anaeromyxobacter diazotrophicus]|uniref:Uncharacterized protein n=1 Tax=Anaeromyxobacter diazotrophicus TaxID=2590199 RepID=A0A7I9VRP9_9BACT|nr:hypothetical protein [Anaeromyxobacter diazotrophicus]GEJ58938.1 hypothetical protein AMYX_36790 [Anaeromyxobacter diazotrophicus]
MTRRTLRAAAALVAASVLAVAPRALAIPAFARKYGTSCVTCHTVYPRLTPFGEAFRRNGYLFPGVDSDFIKQETVPLGQDAAKKAFPNAVWPAWVPSIPGLAIGANGTVVTHPTKGSDAARADSNGQFQLDNLVAEGHLWGGWSIDDSTTLWFEFTVAPGTADLERAQILFNSLFGPKHAFNLVVGRGIPTLSSFGPHSSYLSDTQFVSFAVSDVYGGTGASWQLVDNFSMVELNGVLAGRLEYGVGMNAGSHLTPRGTENVYGHLGVKLGGMRLDGEGSTGSTDTAAPWAETALTVHGFASHANSQFNNAAFVDAAGAPRSLQDVSNTFGVGARAQYGSLELNAEAYWDKHDHATAVAGADGRPGEVKATVVWGELSYILYPWLVPAVRVEHVVLDPTGGVSTNYTRLLPGAALLIRPNVKLVLVATFETASGAPDQGGSWAGVGSALVPPDPNTSESLQFASLNAVLGFVF